MSNINVLPQRTPQALEDLPAHEAYRDTTTKVEEDRSMVGWFRDLNVTDDRTPLLTEAEVEAEWGLPYGKAVAKVLLPNRDDWGRDPKDPTMAREKIDRTLIVFDARKNKHAPPHYIVASEAALNQIAVEPRRLRRLFARASSDIQHIYQDERLHVGASYGRWLPKVLRRKERDMERHPDKYKSRKVISREQTLFYIDDNGELHVRSEGYNADHFVAYPNAAEERHKADAQNLESEMKRKLAARSAASAVMEQTSYVPRHGETHKLIGAHRRSRF